MKTTQPLIHPLSDVQSKHIGAGTRIWQYCVVLPDARLGSDCNICAHCFIENDVIIGDRVTVKCGVHLWDGLRIGDDVFIGPNVAFTNDRFPRSRQHKAAFEVTEIQENASVGAGATILPGLVIGRNAMVGAGAVVTRSVPPNAVVVGNPAKIVSYVDAESMAGPVFQADPSSAVSATSVAGVTLHHLPRFSDIRGSLAVGEFAQHLPFVPKRYFVVFDVPSAETRGEHSHRRCQQFLVCVRGSVSVVADDGRNRQEFLLDRPEIGLYLPPMVWGTQYKYTSDAVVVVFASDSYDASDYIRDYSSFMKLVQSRDHQ